MLLLAKVLKIAIGATAHTGLTHDKKKSSFQFLSRKWQNSSVDIFDLLPRKWANTSDLFFDSSEVSFDSSEEFFIS